MVETAQDWCCYNAVFVRDTRAAQGHWPEGQEYLVLGSHGGGRDCSGKPLSEQTANMRLIDGNHPIETFASNRTDSPHGYAWRRTI
jgi:hypothetical protein